MFLQEEAHYRPKSYQEIYIKLQKEEKLKRREEYQARMTSKVEASHYPS